MAQIGLLERGKQQQQVRNVPCGYDSDEDSCYETNDDNGEKTYSSLNSNEGTQKEEPLTWTIEDKKTIHKPTPTTERVLAELEINHLKTQVKHLKQTKEKLERLVRQKTITEQKAIFELRQVRTSNVEKEHKISAERRRELARAQTKISRLELSIQRRKHELNKVVTTNRKLEEEKESLVERLMHWKLQGCDINGNITGSKKTVSDRERSLVRKSATLSNQIGILERQCKTLKAENDNLKKKVESQKDRSRSQHTEDDKELHLLKLKKEELGTKIAKLQAKVKVIQRETNKKATSERAISILKKDFEHQKLKTELEQRVLLQHKERQIEELQTHCRQLTQEIENIKQETNVKNGSWPGRESELEHILHQAAKERLQLEHQMKILRESLKCDSDKFGSLQAINASLACRLEELQESYHHVGLQLEEKVVHCEELSKWFEEKSRLCSDLETQLWQALDRNTQLSALNSNLQEQLHHLQNVNKECHKLRSTSGGVEAATESAKLEVGILCNKVDSLEFVLRQMREAAEKRKELEREYAEAHEQLVQRQDEIKKLQTNQFSERNKNLEIIENLQSKLRELDKKCELQNVRHEELILEMASIKRLQGKGSGDWESPPSFGTIGNMNQEVQTSPPDNFHTHSDTKCAIRDQFIPNSPNLDLRNELHKPISFRTTTSSELTDTSLHLSGYTPLNSPRVATAKSPCDVCGSVTPSSTPAGMIPITSSNFSTATGPAPYTTSLGRSTTPMQELRSSSPMCGLRSSSPTPGRSRTSSPLPSATSTEIDIMAKLEQDNKILAELEKTRATIGLSSTLALGSTTSTILSKTATDASSANYMSTYKSPLHGLPKTPTKATFAAAFTSNLPATSVPTIITTSHDGEADGQTKSNLLSGNSGSLQDSLDIPGKGRVNVYVARYSYDPFQHSPNENPEAELALKAGDYIYITGKMDEVYALKLGRLQGVGKGYLMKPLSYSLQRPNMCYKFVYANVQSERKTLMEYWRSFSLLHTDGFFEGELLNGKRGLVPSNFVDQLKGDSLLEFQRTILYGLPSEHPALDEDNQVLIVLMPNSASQSESGHQTTSIIGLFKNHPPLSNKDEYRKAVDLSFINLWDLEEEQDEMQVTGEDDDTFFSVLVPAPQSLTLERQLHKSILIRWSPPDIPNNAIEAYDVYVDGLLNTTVKATERTRALIEGVDSAVPHRISVRSVTGKKRTSRDAACTMVIGQDIPIAPSCVRATNVTATSAVISWLPSNSNFQHSVCVNNVEVRAVKAGVYRHTITGLIPNTTYRVSVRVKNIKIPMVEEQPAKKLEMISSFVDFKTLQVGLPDPPLDIQVDAGPQDGTLLVTWLPVTIKDAGTSNGAPVTGYAVFADGKKLLDIDSPTSDHALLDLTKFQGGIPKAITVRTKSFESLSPDSLPTKIPLELIKGSRSKSKSGSSIPSTSESESDPELVELLMQPAHTLPLEYTIFGFKKGLVDGYLDSSDKSELSDIAEEAEEDLSDFSETKDLKNGRDHRDQRMSSRAADSKDGHEKISRREGVGGRGRDDRGRPSQPRGGRDYPSSHDSRGGHGPPRGEPQSPRMPHNDRPPGHAEARRRDGVTRQPYRRYDAHGQVVIEPEENLSDKEVYPQHDPQMTHMSIPSIEITKDSASEGRNSMDNFSDEDYGMGRNSARGRRHPGYHDPRGHHAPEHGGPRSSRGDAYYEREWDSRRQDNSGQYSNEYTRRRGQQDETLRSRYFRALFDYNPQTMSPNPNALDEELMFQEGQVIKIFGDIDPDGFYWGEAQGRKGYVPGNMVTELPPDQTMADHSASTRRGGGDRWNEGYSNLPKRKMVALYDYDPQELSPNVDAEAELSFHTGEIIYVYGDMDEDGFYLGEINGVRGLVPSNFLTVAPPEYREGVRRTTLGPHDASATGKHSQKAGNSVAEEGTRGGRHPVRQGPPQRHLHPQEDRSPKQPTEPGAPGHVTTERVNVNHNQQLTTPAAAPRNTDQLVNRPPQAQITRPDGLVKPQTAASRMPNNFLKPEIIPDAPTSTTTTTTSTTTPAASRGLLGTMTNLAAKLSPMENITAAWDQVSGSGVSQAGSAATTQQQQGQGGEQATQGGGFFSSLLGFAKRS